MTEVLSASSQFDEHYRPSHSSRSHRSPRSGSSSSSIPRSYQQPSKQYDTHCSYLTQPSSLGGKGNTIITKLPVPQANRSQFLFYDVEDQDEDIDFPVYDYAETITPDASPDLDPSPSLSESFTPPSSSTVSPQNSPEPELHLCIALDDNTIRHEPSRHVDYLSHNWKEEDIWSSWRYMIGKRKYYQNGARLENASWRTWAKAKFNLKTLSPEKLDWLKDCDVTWLYGPLSTGADKISQYASPQSPSIADQPIQSINALVHTKKPILKKRSMSEAMLQRSLSTSSLIKQAAAAIHSQQSEGHNMPRPSLTPRAHSDFSTYPLQYVRESEVNTNELPSALSSGTHSPAYSRHIHFNNRVEQCIAVDKMDDDDFGYDIGVDDSDSSDDGLVMMASSRTSTRSTPRGSFSEHQTIAMLPSTTLKPVDDLEPMDSRRQEPLGNGFVSFLSSLGSSIPSSSKPASDCSTMVSSAIAQSNFLVDDDDDMDDYAWQPTSAFANRRDSIAIARPKFGIDAAGNQDSELKATDSDSDEGESPTGLFGRAVDAVNTARDIAHVLWNVGWRK